MSQEGKNYSDLGLLLLRIGIGMIFIVAGWGKLSRSSSRMMNNESKSKSMTVFTAC